MLHAEFVTSSGRSTGASRGSGKRLRDAIGSMAGPHCEIVRHAEKPWASVTFEGARHTFTLRFTGCEGVAAGEVLVEALPEHEFALRGQLVAEARVIAADHRLIPEPVLELTCELLLLQDA